MKFIATYRTVNNPKLAFERDFYNNEQDMIDAWKQVSKEAAACAMPNEFLAKIELDY